MKTAYLWIAAALAAGCASEFDRKLGQRTLPDPAWREECGSCHVLFPPQMLAANDWGTMMRGLDRHFGIDASIDDASRDKILAFLAAHAAPSYSTRHSAGSLRITETPYFLSVHGGSSIPLWTGSEDKKASNCPACHKSDDDQLW